MQHIVLLGDSIFDNGSYVDSNEDVTTHLRGIVRKDSKVTLCAGDGAVIDDIPNQLKSIPDDATTLVLSIGGNDVLQYKSVLTNNSLSAIDFLIYFSDILEEFRNRYKKVVTTIFKRRFRLIVCTIYNGNLEQEIMKPARVTLSLFNDIIYQIATEYKIDVIELRNICTDPADYANSIEPSGIGGKKIAKAIRNTVGRGEKRRFEPMHLV